MATAGKVIKCKAAVAWEYGKPLVNEEIEVAPPEADEVRIKIVATAVCHTDLYHLFEGMETELFPTILGHESAGIVESVGSSVTEFQPGDKVIPLFINQCRECRFCRSPKTNLCEKGPIGAHDKLAFEKSRITCKGKKVLPFMGIGSFSEYVLMKQIAVAKIDPVAPLDKVCLIGCAISTGFGAAVNTAKVEAGSTCAVFGLGAVGLAAVMGCKFAGAERIIAVDTNPKKAEKAKVFGATDFVNPKDQNKPINQVLAEMTNGGVDYSFECVGNVEVMRSALESCNPGWGVSVIVGWTNRHDFAARPIQLIVGRTWKGSLFGGFKSKDGVPEMVRAYLQKKIKVDEFITHSKTLAQVNEGFELMKSGQRHVYGITPSSLLHCKS
uniref:Enoyl reductase (ER) domain-containing protein n=1 Tax=Oryzias latipes TaxID=8090 RepID=A0A3P9HYF7_ORYLA